MTYVPACPMCGSPNFVSLPGGPKTISSGQIGRLRSIEKHLDEARNDDSGLWAIATRTVNALHGIIGELEGKLEASTIRQVRLTPIRERMNRSASVIPTRQKIRRRIVTTTEPTPTMMTSGDADFHAGVMAALAIVYQFDAETIAEEIVRACSHEKLVSVARREDDPWLGNLRATIREVNRKRRTGKRRTG